MTAYSFALNAHGGLRWLVLLLVVVLIIKSLIGWLGSGTYKKLDNILAASFTGLMHIQLLLGLVLYFFLSPITKTAFGDFGGAMKDSILRFWAVEHLFLMLLALVAAQVGRSISKKSADDGRKFRMQSIFFILSLVLMIMGIPWNRI